MWWLRVFIGHQAFWLTPYSSTYDVAIFGHVTVLEYTFIIVIMQTVTKY